MSPFFRKRPAPPPNTLSSTVSPPIIVVSILLAVCCNNRCAGALSLPPVNLLTIRRVQNSTAHLMSSAGTVQRTIVAASWALRVAFGPSEADALHGTEEQHTAATSDVRRWPGEECDRNCTDATLPRWCYYSWTLEHYAAMGSACNLDCTINGNHTACHRPTAACLPLDGIARTVMTINRQLPGPSLHVCRGDRIVVDVANHMHGTATSVHWHGAHQRHGSAHMDGVPFVTQCAIPAGTRFRYAFAAREAGTHFYHAHAGHHKSNGLYGAMIVRDRMAAESSESDRDYDEDRSDHVVLISDALHALAESLMPGLPGRRIRPESVLINGHGRWATPTAAPPLLAVFHVRAGRRYRFRIINSASHMCPMRLQIEQHRMRVIATDGTAVRPLLVDALYSSGGERYDVAVRADGRPGAEYWMRVRIVGACEATQRLEQFAVVRYAADAADEDEGRRAGSPTREMPAYDEELEMAGNRQLNHPDTDSSKPADHQSEDFCITHLQSIEPPDQQLLHGVPDVRLTMSFANRVVDNEQLFAANRYDHFMNIGGDQNLMGTINNISFGFPSEPLLLLSGDQQRAQANAHFCAPGHLPQRCHDLPPDYPCTCTQVVRLPLGAVVELSLVDGTEDATMSHPFHLHGTSFYAMAIGYDANIRQASRIPVPQRPPPKDTVTVPRNGFVVLRFRADNPGYWLLHCHFEWHLAVGMAALFQIGDPASDIRPAVPEDMPRCGSYLPAAGR